MSACSAFIRVTQVRETHDTLSSEECLSNEKKSGGDPKVNAAQKPESVRRQTCTVPLLVPVADIYRHTPPQLAAWP